MTEHYDARLPCFKCGKTIEEEPLTKGLRNAMPFTSRGGYGSTVYDPVGLRLFLRINICDNCVLEGAAEGTILEGTKIPVPDKITYTLLEVDGEQ